MSRGFLAIALLLVLAPTPGWADSEGATSARERRTGQDAKQERDLRLPLAEWTGELELSATQVTQLKEVDHWLLNEGRRLREAQRNGQLGYSALAVRARTLKEDLRAKLAEHLSPEQVAGIDLDALFPREVPALLLTIRGSTQATFAAGFDAGPGDVSTFSYTASAQVRIALGRPVSLTLGLSGGSSLFDFTDALELDPISRDPFQELHTASVSLGLTWQITSNWTAFASGSASANGEAGAAFEDAVTYGVFGGVSYTFSKTFSLGLGVSIRTRLEDRPQIFPLPILRLKVEFTNELRLSLGVPDGIRLTYAPLDELEFSLTGGLGGALNAQDARLDNTGFAPGGVFRQTTVPIQAVLDWRPLPIFKVTVQGGVIAYREYEIDDARGHNLTEVKTSPTGFVQFTLSVTF